MTGIEVQAKIKSLEKQIADLKEELANLPDGRFMPSKNQDYFTWENIVFGSTWSDHRVDHQRYSLGLVFMTKEDAEFDFERQKVIAELRGYAKVNTIWDGQNEHYYLYYDASAKNIKLECRSSYNLGYLSFSTREYAEEAIAAIGEDRLKKYYFNVKEDQS